MNNYRGARKLDANHLAIQHAMEAAGCFTVSLAPLGNGKPDLFWFHRASNRFGFLEIKRAGPPSAAKLTPLEESFHLKAKAAGIPLVVVQSVEEALALVRIR
jgi:hypothetical protein